MKGLQRAVWLAAMAAAGGCNPQPGGPPASAAPAATAAMNPSLCRMAYDSLQSAGGFQTWQNVSVVRVKAVVTLYGENREAHVDQQELTIHLTAGVIEATAQTPGGSWYARADAAGEFHLVGEGLPADRALRQRIGQALVTILHRYRGPMNFLLGAERPAGQTNTVVDGVDVVRVGAAGGSADAKAYYYGQSDRLVRFVTVGADQPGGAGTVTLYEYQWHPKGLALPREFRVVRIGQHVLVGRDPGDLLMEVAFSDARL